MRRCVLVCDLFVAPKSISSIDVFQIGTIQSCITSFQQLCPLAILTHESVGVFTCVSLGVMRHHVQRPSPSVPIENRKLMVTTKKNGFLFVNLIAEDDPTGAAQIAMLAHYQDKCSAPIEPVPANLPRSNQKVSTQQPHKAPCRAVPHSSPRGASALRPSPKPLTAPPPPSLAVVASPARLAPSTRVRSAVTPRGPREAHHGTEGDTSPVAVLIPQRNIPKRSPMVMPLGRQGITPPAQTSVPNTVPTAAQHVDPRDGIHSPPSAQHRSSDIPVFGQPQRLPVHNNKSNINLTQSTTTQQQPAAVRTPPSSRAVVLNNTINDSRPHCLNPSQNATIIGVDVFDGRSTLSATSDVDDEDFKVVTASQWSFPPKTTANHDGPSSGNKSPHTTVIANSIYMSRDATFVRGGGSRSFTGTPYCPPPEVTLRGDARVPLYGGDEATIVAVEMGSIGDSSSRGVARSLPAYDHTIEIHSGCSSGAAPRSPSENTSAVILGGAGTDVTVDCWRHRRQMLQQMYQATVGSHDGDSPMLASQLHDVSAIPNNTLHGTPSSASRIRPPSSYSVASSSGKTSGRGDLSPAAFTVVVDPSLYSHCSQKERPPAAPFVPIPVGNVSAGSAAADGPSEVVAVDSPPRVAGEVSSSRGGGVAGVRHFVPAPIRTRVSHKDFTGGPAVVDRYGDISDVSESDGEDFDGVLLDDEDGCAPPAGVMAEGSGGLLSNILSPMSPGDCTVVVDVTDRRRGEGPYGASASPGRYETSGLSTSSFCGSPQQSPGGGADAHSSQLGASIPLTAGVRGSLGAVVPSLPVACPPLCPPLACAEQPSLPDASAPCARSLFSHSTQHSVAGSARERGVRIVPAHAEHQRGNASCGSWRMSSHSANIMLHGGAGDARPCSRQSAASSSRCVPYQRGVDSQSGHFARADRDHGSSPCAWAANADTAEGRVGHRDEDATRTTDCSGSFAVIHHGGDLVPARSADGGDKEEGEEHAAGGDGLVFDSMIGCYYNPSTGEFIMPV